MTVNKFSLPLSMLSLRTFAIGGGDFGFVLRDERRLGLFGAELFSVVQCQPELNQVGQQGVFLRRIAPSDGAAANVLAKLDLEFRRMAPVGAFDDMTFS